MTKIKKIHRKNQVWLYQKFKQEQDMKHIEKIYIKKPEKKITKGTVEKMEKVYICLDLMKYGIPVLMAVAGIQLIF